MLAVKVFESTGIQILTDLSFISSCETITDVVNDLEPETYNYEYYGYGNAYGDSLQAEKGK